MYSMGSVFRSQIKGYVKLSLVLMINEHLFHLGLVIGPENPKKKVFEDFWGLPLTAK